LLLMLETRAILLDQLALMRCDPPPLFGLFDGLTHCCSFISTFKVA
jgi:hypothetical protein